MIKIVTNGQAGAGYVTNGIDYLKKVQQVFKQSEQLLLKKGHKLHASAPDMLWKKLQRQDVWLAFNPMNVGIQYASYSDNKKTIAAYKHK